MQFQVHLWLVSACLKAIAQKKEGKMKSIRRQSGVLSVMMILLFCLLLAAETTCAAANKEPTVTIPWEEKDAKQPTEYTFEEFDSLRHRRTRLLTHSIRLATLIHGWIVHRQ